VRDQNSFWLVRGTTGREAPTVLDPVLQFPEIGRTPAGPEEEPFALVYGHSFPVWFVAALERWARSSGVRLRSIGYHNAFSDEQLLEAGPFEFARLMRGARAVITNYFHGCVFALLNAKPFATVTSDYRRNKVRDLASAFDAQERIVEPDTPQLELDRLLANPPGPRVFERIAEARQQSREFLHGALA
jgi:hypothetical protein